MIKYIPNVKIAAALVAGLFVIASTADVEAAKPDREKPSVVLPIITSAEPNIADKTLRVTGDNFADEEAFIGVVEIYLAETGLITLIVDSFTISQTAEGDSFQQLVVSGLPANIEDFAGTHLLVVRRGQPVENIATFDVTIGGGGPEGPAGQDGADGAQGPAGQDGADGAQGPIGPQGPAGTNGTNGADGAQGPQGDQGPEGASPFILNGNDAYYIQGNIGVGTSTPTEALDVGGNLNISPTAADGTSGVIMQGGIPLMFKFGNGNFFAGLDAGNFTMTGGANTANGVRGLYAITIGNGNTASGYEALFSNTTGSENTATGRLALRSNTEGGANTANGALALFNNTEGGANTASGHNALLSNTTGSLNTASGVNALYSNTEGGANTANGFQALLFNTTGEANTANGFQALQFNTSGALNTATGHNSLLLNTTGNYNTATGWAALRNNTEGSDNTACGRAALFLNTTGLYNAACGYRALHFNTTGSYNTAIGYCAEVSTGDLTNATAIGASAVVDASNKIRLGNTDVTVIEGQVPFTFTSDRNAKENFRPVDGLEVLEKIRNLEVTSWNYIGHEPKQFRHYGPMAQDFHAAFGTDALGNIGTPTTINGGDLAGITLAAIKGLAMENENLSKKNSALEERLSRLEERFSREVGSKPVGTEGGLSASN